MGLLRWLMERSSGDVAAAQDEGTANDQMFADSFELPSRNFFGPCSRSPNRRYTLACCDADDVGMRGGARSSGLGRYILLEGREDPGRGQSGAAKRWKSSR
jgi:hypothetical protein